MTSAAPGTRLTRQGLASLGVKVGNLALSFLVGIVLARLLGPASYGIYAFALALVFVLALPAEAGLPSLVLRETAGGDHAGAVRGVLRWSLVLALVVSASVILAVMAAFALGVGAQAAQTGAVVAGLVLIPCLAGLRILGAALRGQGAVILGQVPDSLLRPTLLLAGLAVLWGIDRAPQSGATAAMALHGLAAGMALMITVALVVRRAAAPAEPVYRTRAWLTALWPLSLFTGLQVLNAHVDLLILGLFRPAETVGLYRAAMQTALLVGFGLQAASMVAAPRFARLAAVEDRAGLQTAVRWTARAGLAAALPMLTIALAFGAGLLSLLFGAPFGAAAAPLAVLAAGQAAAAATGAVGHLMNMAGHERVTVGWTALATAVHLGAAVLLVPLYGAMGAASASAVSLVLLNAGLWRAAKRRLGVRCGPL